MSNPVWKNRKLLICVGTGGVGKTTVAASIALAAAKSGLKTLVMTIDPARRLANALGIEDIGNTEKQIPAHVFQELGFPLKAPLWVMMPNVKETFDGVVNRVASSVASRNSILENRFYTSLSTALAGAQEFAAVEKLYEVYHSGKYDLIVLDTPPSQNAIDFLEAPGKMIDFLEHESLQWLVKPYAVAGKLSLRALDIGSNLMHRTIGKMAGGETLRELAQFLIALSTMFDGFRQRYNEVRQLLHSKEVAFHLVSSPHHNQRSSMIRFYRELQAGQYSPSAIVINRLRNTEFGEGDIALIKEKCAKSFTPTQLESLELILTEEAALLERDKRAIEYVRKKLPGLPIITLPELALDAHDLTSLINLHGAFEDIETTTG